ncbi:hypothetical protein MNBD_BACTEROID01-1748 [hydrothermal vent metagenome]|uniref:Doubled CXXCH motif domain-containing protein n=1 Tax=hydrothermal vent metagenome TaxID=652676 RepID=A0A3B0UN72_9ZZZZ
MPQRKKKYFPLLIFLIFIIACSTQYNYKTLSFFFDGVPNPGDQDLQVSNDSLTTDSTQNRSLRGQGPVPEYSFHAPYKAKECASCHDQGTMGKLLQPQPGLCFQCHDDFNNSFEALHGPVAGGYCTTCHNPHQAKERKLLVRNGEELCLYCHNPELVRDNLFHNISEETNCLTCHNPHGGENRFLIKKGACFLCHDDFKGQFNFLHGPVAGGFCLECHSPHIEGTENLLSRKGQELCLYCHNKENVFRNEVHEDIEDADCTECHNPHGGEDRYILN